MREDKQIVRNSSSVNWLAVGGVGMQLPLVFELMTLMICGQSLTRNRLVSNSNWSSFLVDLNGNITSLCLSHDRKSRTPLSLSPLQIEIYGLVLFDVPSRLRRSLLAFAL